MIELTAQYLFIKNIPFCNEGDFIKDDAMVEACSMHGGI